MTEIKQIDVYNCKGLFTCIINEPLTIKDEKLEQFRTKIEKAFEMITDNVDVFFILKQ